ncbi:MAG: DUF1292 domain-containing protein [Mycoplasmatota bacterium]|nr:DUF1292 domain-containing protein [Mycoplasmatota bacterium]
MGNNIEIVKSDGTVEKVELVTYLLTDDGLNKYIVYTKGEKQGAEGDQVIYISKVISDNGTLQIQEITDDNEWVVVQGLLKKIANA